MDSNINLNIDLVTTMSNPDKPSETALVLPLNNKINIFIVDNFPELLNHQFDHIRDQNQMGIYLAEEIETEPGFKLQWLKRQQIMLMPNIYIRGKIIGLINTIDPTRTIVILFRGNEAVNLDSIFKVTIDDGTD